MKEFEWIDDIEPGRYYMITHESYNNHGGMGEKFREDEWVLFLVTPIDEQKVHYKLIHRNLKKDRNFTRNSGGTIDMDHFKGQLDGKYWVEVHELPTPTLFEENENIETYYERI